MANELEGIEIPVPCPRCGHNTLESLRWLKTHDEIPCSHCKETIHLDDHGFRDALLDAEKSVARIRNGFRDQPQ